MQNLPLPNNPLSRFIQRTGLSTSQIAKMVNMAQSTVWRHLHEKRGLSLQAQQRYHKLLGISYLELYTWAMDVMQRRASEDANDSQDQGTQGRDSCTDPTRTD